MKGNRLYHERWEEEVCMDVSDTVAAVYTIHERYESHIAMPDKIKCTGSAFHETYNVLMILISKQIQWRGKSIRVWTDSLSSTIVLNRNGANNTLLNALLQSIIAVCFGNALETQRSQVYQPH